MTRCSSLTLLFSALALLAGCASAPRSSVPATVLNDSNVVAFYDGTVLTLPTFEERYARTVGGWDEAADDSLQAYQDFLERYVNYRLKVRAAQEAGLATDSSIQAEIRAYRTNLARPYLLEQEILEPIIRERYARMKEQVDVSHILIRVAPDASPADTLAAYNRLSAIVDSLQMGEDFGELALRNSEDPSARNARQGIGYRGRLGFFSTGRMVAPFEDWAYATPVGDVSPIFRTQFGYHVLYVHDRQPEKPQMRLAHLMITPGGPHAADSAEAATLLHSLRDRVLAGEDFRALASEFSDDQSTRQQGGVIPVWLDYNNPQLPPSFKEAAFALEQEGDVTDIVATPFGLHLIQLLERKTVGTYEEEYDGLKQSVSRLPAVNVATRNLAREIRTQYGGTLDSAFVREVFAAVPADSIPYVLPTYRLPADHLDRTFATLGDSAYTLRDLARFTEQNGVDNKPDKDQRLFSTIDRFVTEAAIDYEVQMLEKRDPEFAQIMQEFRDGLMLFRIMEDSVWNAAAQDSAALKAYFDARSSFYRFPDRTRIIEFRSVSDSLLRAVAAQLDAGVSVPAVQQQFALREESQVTTDTTYLTGPTQSLYDKALAVAPGAHTEIERHLGSFVLFVNDGMDPARPKTFEEARPEVVTAYQEVLEDRLIERLRTRYQVRTFPERLVRAFDETSAAAVSPTASTR